MNPMPTQDLPHFYGHSQHAGGWPKLGWQRPELDPHADAHDEAHVSEEAHGGAFA